MGISTDYLNADPLYRRARQLGNRHDRPSLEIQPGGRIHPLVTVAIWAVIVLSTGIGAAMYASKL